MKEKTIRSRIEKLEKYAFAGYMQAARQLDAKRRETPQATRADIAVLTAFLNHKLTAWRSLAETLDQMDEADELEDADRRTSNGGRTI